MMKSTRNAWLASITVAWLSAPVFAQNTTWVNDWFDSYTSTGSGSYEGQQRGYYTMGSFQGRWRMSNDYLVSVSPPRIKTGCGGIDIFGGAFSYLDPEFLVEKFERMIQAAPAFAFDLALQELCKPCVTAMQAFEDITDQLNSIQVNDCALAKKTVAYVANNIDPDIGDQEGLKQEVAAWKSVGDNMRKNWHAFQTATRANNNQAPDDIKTDLQGCSAVYRDIFANGSVVANMSARFGLDEYADLIRGMIGDVVVTPTATDYSIRPMNACPGNDQFDGADFLAGTVELMNVAGECRASGESRVVDVIETRLRGIADRMRGGTALTADDISFVQNSPIPIYALLRDSVIAGNTEEMLRTVREPLAVSYGHKILDDFLRSSTAVLRKAKEIAVTVSVDPAGAAGRCNTEALKSANDTIQQLSTRAEDYRNRLHQNYTKKTAEMLAQLQASREFLELRRQTLNRAAASIKQ
jgi:conjugative transfer pilus assembly protein TraH